MVKFPDCDSRTATLEWDEVMANGGLEELQQQLAVIISKVERLQHDVSNLSTVLAPPDGDGFITRVVVVERDVAQLSAQMKEHMIGYATRETRLALAEENLRDLRNRSASIRQVSMSVGLALFSAAVAIVGWFTH